MMYRSFKSGRYTCTHFLAEGNYAPGQKQYKRSCQLTRGLSNSLSRRSKRFRASSSRKLEQKHRRGMKEYLFYVNSGVLMRRPLQPWHPAEVSGSPEDSLHPVKNYEWHLPLDLASPRSLFSLLISLRQRALWPQMITYTKCIQYNCGSRFINYFLFLGTLIPKAEIIFWLFLWHAPWLCFSPW